MNESISKINNMVSVSPQLSLEYPRYANESMKRNPSTVRGGTRNLINMSILALFLSLICCVTVAIFCVFDLVSDMYFSMSKLTFGSSREILLIVWAFSPSTLYISWDQKNQNQKTESSTNARILNMMSTTFGALTTSLSVCPIFYKLENIFFITNYHEESLRKSKFS